MKKHPDLTAENLADMRKKVLAKGAEMAKKLEDALAGQDVTLDDIPLLGEPDPEWKKIVRLRMYLKLLNEALARINDGSVGWCQVCEDPIPVAELMELPWAEVDSKCAGKMVVAKKAD